MRIRCAAHTADGWCFVVGSSRLEREKRRRGCLAKGEQRVSEGGRSPVSKRDLGGPSRIGL